MIGKGRGRKGGRDGWMDWDDALRDCVRVIRKSKYGTW